MAMKAFGVRAAAHSTRPSHRLTAHLSRNLHNNLHERGFQARGLLRQRWIASARAWMPGESIP
ncbi:MAG: hypothetical protein CL911_01645, partial [Deltaproteobacteria bacterium]|nr:hypothetical protein [Deltaproteobacteria bacterium]